MNRLIFLNRYFFPDHSATSRLLGDAAFHMAESGKEVHVITSRQLYEAPRARLAANELVRGVHIHRVATTAFGRYALAGRALDYASYWWSMRRCLARLVTEGDVVVAKTDPPLTSIFAMGLLGQRKAHLVNWLQDLYPEAAMALGVPLIKGPAGQALTYLRDLSLQRASANVTVGIGMAARVKSRGVAPERIHIIPNWIDDEQIRPLRDEENPLRQEWGLQQKFVVGYSGNLGRAHEFDSILAAAERLQKHPHILFLFIGGGHQFNTLARAAKTRGLEKAFRFVSYQPDDQLNHALNIADVHLVSLRPDAEGLIVPSKFYGIAAAGKPVISISASDGEIGQLVRQSQCGHVVKPGDGEALAQAILWLAENPILVSEMGGRARALLDRHFSRRNALIRWTNLLSVIANTPCGGFASSKPGERKIGAG